jgi:hypothetical protein
MMSCQLFVFILLRTQPFLISGIEDEAHAAVSAFGASGMFLFTFVASLFGIWYDGSTKAKPIHHNGESEADYHLSKDTPSNYGTTA